MMDGWQALPVNAWREKSSLELIVNNGNRLAVYSSR